MIPATQPAAVQTLTLRFRLRDKHSSELNRQAKAVNYVWNYCNQTQRHAAGMGRKWLTGFDLSNLTSGSSRELNLHAHTISRVCRVYEICRKAARKPWLRWRGRKSLGWVPFNTGHVSFSNGMFRFRGADYGPMHIRSDMPSTFGAGSFSQDARGRWYINVATKVGCASPSHSRPAVGIDLGLKSLATLSDGAIVIAPHLYRASEHILAVSQRARKSKRTRAIHAKIVNRRKDHLHKASRRIADIYGLIIVGDVSSTKLAQTKMAKSIYDAGWSRFKMMLAYKSIGNGAEMIEVSERLSTQTCSGCGSLPPSRPKGIAGLRIREWRCDDCGAVHDRDVNAARNILRGGMATLAEGALS